MNNYFHVSDGKMNALFSIFLHFCIAKILNYQQIEKMQYRISEKGPRASLVAQWLGIHLPMQGTWVRALVREDPTRRRATKPVRHHY